jgi:hypothetical protein
MSMRNRDKQRTAALFLIICISLPVTVLAQDREKPVKLKDLPTAVQTAIREQGRGAVIRAISKEIKNGETVYEAELIVKGHNKDVLIDANGKVVEIEERIELSSLPPAVKNEIVKQAGKRRIVAVESITKDSVVVAYEAHVKGPIKTSEIKVSADGSPIN